MQAQLETQVDRGKLPEEDTTVLSPLHQVGPELPILRVMFSPDKLREAQKLGFKPRLTHTKKLNLELLRRLSHMNH